MLTGKFSAGSKLPEDDLRHKWDFKEGAIAERLKKLELLREILTGEGRSLAQAAIGWLWARSERMIPIPGFKTVKQVEENAGAVDFGPLSGEQMSRIAEIVGR